MLVCYMCFHLPVIIQTKRKWRRDWCGYLKRSWYFIPLKANEKIGASCSLQILQIAFIIRVLVFASVGVWNSHLYLSRKHCKDLIKLLQLDSRYGYLTRFWSCTHFQILAKISILIFAEINIAPSEITPFQKKSQFMITKYFRLNILGSTGLYAFHSHQHLNILKNFNSKSCIGFECWLS